MATAVENKGSRPSSAPSSQGSGGVKLLRKPMTTRPQDHAVPVSGK